MTDQCAVVLGDERHNRRTRSMDRLDEIRFRRSLERSFVDLANSRSVARLLGSDRRWSVRVWHFSTCRPAFRPAQSRRMPAGRRSMLKSREPSANAKPAQEPVQAQGQAEECQISERDPPKRLLRRKEKGVRLEIKLCEQTSMKKHIEPERQNPCRGDRRHHPRGGHRILFSGSAPIYHGALFNVWLVNLPCVVILSIPLADFTHGFAHSKGRRLPRTGSYRLFGSFDHLTEDGRDGRCCWSRGTLAGPRGACIGSGQGADVGAAHLIQQWRGDRPRDSDRDPPYQ